jgi:hypothetical protein
MCKYIPVIKSDEKNGLLCSVRHLTRIAAIADEVYLSNFLINDRGNTNQTLCSE